MKGVDEAGVSRRAPAGDNLRCVQEELGHLQGLWTMVERVLGTFAEWHATLWDRINVDELTEHTKALAREVKALNKAVRLYGVFGWAPCCWDTPWHGGHAAAADERSPCRKLEEAIKAMQTSLPLVLELRHPAMRPRHWKQLMKVAARLDAPALPHISGSPAVRAWLQATGTQFVMDEGFSLGALLRLGLHQHVEACSEIVDRAERELVIENALRRIEDAWGGLALAFAPHQARFPAGQHRMHPGGTRC